MALVVAFRIQWVRWRRICDPRRVSKPRAKAEPDRRTFERPKTTKTSEGAEKQRRDKECLPTGGSHAALNLICYASGACEHERVRANVHRVYQPSRVLLPVWKSFPFKNKTRNSFDRLPHVVKHSPPDSAWFHTTTWGGGALQKPWKKHQKNTKARCRAGQACPPLTSCLPPELSKANTYETPPPTHPSHTQIILTQTVQAFTFAHFSTSESQAHSLPIPLAVLQQREILQNP